METLRLHDFLLIWISQKHRPRWTIENGSTLARWWGYIHSNRCNSMPWRVAYCAK